MNDFWHPKEKRIGLISFENFWGERLSWVKITHYLDNLIHVNYWNKHFYIIEDIEDKEVRDNLFAFDYEVGSDSYFNYWQLEVITEKGSKYKTKERFYCSLSYDDDGKVILSVNGDSKRMYVYFSSSSSCSTALKSA